MRISALTKTVLAAAAALLLFPGAPAQAQFFVGSGNSQIGTIGDPNASLYRSRVSRRYALNYAKRGLFADAESYGSPGAPRPFIFSFPAFTVAGSDFTGKTFEEYLDIVAKSYGLTHGGDYLLRFNYSNPTVYNDDWLFTYSTKLYNEFINDRDAWVSDVLAFYNVSNPGDLPPELQPVFYDQLGQEQFSIAQRLEPQALWLIHEEDFLNRGGYLPLPGDPRTPTDPGDLPGTDDDPIFKPLPTGDGDGADTTVDVVDAAALANQIAATLDDPATAQALLEAVAPASASQAEQQASVIPEPASLALITLGAASFLTRARRR